jgi:hypothetical protein
MSGEGNLVQGQSIDEPDDVVAEPGQRVGRGTGTAPMSAQVHGDNVTAGLR